MPGTQRFPMLLAQRFVPHLALAMVLVSMAVIDAKGPRLVGVALCGLLGWAIGTQRKRRPEVVIDDTGYAIERRGRPPLRVAWSEVKRVRADAEEKACHVDCGEPARNLLVPPERGWGFRFERSDALYDAIVAAVPDKVERVARLDAPAKK